MVKRSSSLKSLAELNRIRFTQFEPKTVSYALGGTSCFELCFEGVSFLGPFFFDLHSHYSEALTCSHGRLGEILPAVTLANYRCSAQPSA